MSHENGSLHPTVCGGCRHWRAQPQNPMQLAKEDDRNGECRQGPPHVTVIFAQTGQGVAAAGQAAQYPVLPRKFPACSKYEAVPATIGLT